MVLKVSDEFFYVICERGGPRLTRGVVYRAQELQGTGGLLRLCADDFGIGGFFSTDRFRLSRSPAKKFKL